MPKTTSAKEIIVTCPNKPGTLARVASALAEAKQNIDACCCYAEAEGGNCNLHVVTADPAKTLDLCKKSGWSAKTNDVVCCELANTPGTLATTCNTLAGAGVDIQYCYFTTGNGGNTRVYFCTGDNAKAAKVLG